MDRTLVKEDNTLLVKQLDCKVVIAQGSTLGNAASQTDIEWPAETERLIPGLLVSERPCVSGDAFDTSQLPSRTARRTALCSIERSNKAPHRRMLTRADSALLGDDADASVFYVDLSTKHCSRAAQLALREEADPLVIRRQKLRKMKKDLGCPGVPSVLAREVPLRDYISLGCSKINKDLDRPGVPSVLARVVPLRDYISMGCRKMNFVRLLRKRVLGEAGVSVAALLDLQQSLIALNLFLFLLFLSTIVLPATLIPASLRQEELTNGTGSTVAAACSYKYNRQLDDYIQSRGGFFNTFIDMIKGTGVLERSPAFLGWYPSQLGHYNVHYAYLISTAIAYFISISFVVKEFGSWLRNRADYADMNYFYNNVIFKGWNFHIRAEEAALAEQKHLAKEIKAGRDEELFLETQNNQTECETMTIWCVRTLIHLVVFGLIIAGWTLIWKIERNEHFFTLIDHKYASSLTIILLNVVWKEIFQIFSKFEKYNSHDELLLFIIRNLCLSLVSIIVLVISEIKLVHDNEDNACNENNMCWETTFGQKIYFLIILTTLLEIILAILSSLRCALAKIPKGTFLIRKVPEKLWRKVTNQYFKTPNKVLVTVKLQTLCWVGLTVAPLTGAMVMLSMLIMIFLNTVSVLGLKMKPKITFRASKSDSLFIGALLLALALSLCPSLLILTWLKPSEGCSPFRGLQAPCMASDGKHAGTCDSVINCWGAFSLVCLSLLLIMMVYFTVQAEALKAEGKHREQRLLTETRYKKQLMDKLKSSSQEKQRNQVRSSESVK